jgi:Protein of unknown function (DUF5661)
MRHYTTLTIDISDIMESFKQFFKKVNLNIDYDPEQVKMGIEVEMEHTTNPKIAEIIAKQHLSENPKYYTKLKKMEGTFKNEG